MTANEAREGPKRTREDTGFVLSPSGPPSRIVLSQNWPTSFTDCSQPCAGLDSERRVPGTERHIPGQPQPVLWATSMSPYSSRPRRDRLRFTEPGRRGQGSYRGADPPLAACPYGAGRAAASLVEAVPAQRSHWLGCKSAQRQFEMILVSRSEPRWRLIPSVQKIQAVGVTAGPQRMSQCSAAAAWTSGRPVSLV